jgi:hypothetical protein
MFLNQPDSNGKGDHFWAIRRINSLDPSFDGFPATSSTEQSSPQRLSDRMRQILPYENEYPSGLSCHPITGPTDPRWVLAIKTAHSLQGRSLRAIKRAHLLRLGKRLGLPYLASNRIITIILQQAQQGFAPKYCPLAGQAMLSQIPLPGAYEQDPRQWRLIHTVFLIAALLAIEIAAILLAISYA